MKISRKLVMKISRKLFDRVGYLVERMARSFVGALKKHLNINYRKSKHKIRYSSVTNENLSDCSEYYREH